MPEIFFSAGSDGSALYNANASAAAGVLTLATPAVGKIGLGDEIREGANRYYIRQRNSSTEFLIQTPTGGTAITFSLTGITIYRAFASVNAAENGASGASYLNTVDLVTNTINLTIIQMNDGADSNAVDIDGWTVNSTYYVTIRTPIGESEIGTRARHMGKLDTSFAHFVNDTSVSGFIACHDPQIRLTGLQVDASSGTGYRRPIRYFGYTAGDSDGLRISSCIVKGNGNGDWQTPAIAAATNVVGVTVRIWNCVVTNSKDAFEFCFSGGADLWRGAAGARAPTRCTTKSIMSAVTSCSSSTISSATKRAVGTRPRSRMTSNKSSSLRACASSARTRSTGRTAFSCSRSSVIWRPIWFVLRFPLLAVSPPQRQAT